MKLVSILAALAALTLPACAMFNSAPAGLVSGVVLFNGEPVAGKRVSLLGTDKRTYTDASGRYAFANVPAGQRLRVSYTSLPDRDHVTPNEVAEWQSAPFALDGAGRDLPPFDVSYNGLLYPGERNSLIVKADSPVPFHWSTHPTAQRYRLRIDSNKGATIWTGEWAADPTGIFAQEVTPGTYRWYVEIDGGDRGTGKTTAREVDF